MGTVPKLVFFRHDVSFAAVQVLLGYCPPSFMVRATAFGLGIDGFEDVWN